MLFPAAPLRSMMAVIAAACVAGASVTAGLALGYASWQVFAAAGVIGLVIGIPLGIWTARRMRAQPPLPRPESATSDPDSAERAVFRLKPRPYPPAPDQTYA